MRPNFVSIILYSVIPNDRKEPVNTNRCIQILHIVTNDENPLNIIIELGHF